MKRPLWVLLLLTPTLAIAHEGHDVLPSKGVTVQGNSVLLTLEARNAIGLRTTDVQTQTLEKPVFAPVRVELAPRAHAFATTQLAGRVEQILVAQGQRMRADEPLAYVQAPELERLFLDATTAHLDLRLAQNELDRVEELARSGIRNPREVLASRNRVQERQNALLLARLKLKALGLEPSQELAASSQLLPVRSPIAGVVAHLDVAQGMIVDPQQHLFDVADGSRVRLRAEVSEAFVPLIALDQEVRVHLRGLPPGSDPLMGKVIAREGRIDARNLAETIWISAPSGAPLRPGMAGQARILVHQRKQVLVVPDTAVIRDGIETFVFVQIQPPSKTQAGRYERKFVTLGLNQGGLVEIKTGLFSIDAVVTTGQRQLSSLFLQGVLRPSAEARKNVGLALDTVARHAVGEVLELDAVLELPPSGRSIVAAPLAGKIVQVAVPTPQRVAAGEPLAEVASLEFQSLQMDLIQADLAVHLHQATLDSYARVEPASAIPRQLMQEAETNLHIAQARVDSTTRRLRTLGLPPAEIGEIRTKHAVRPSYWLRAPRDGYVLPVEQAVGQVVKEGASLFEVRDPSKLWARARMFDQDLPRVHEGQAARLRIPSLPGFIADTTIARLEVVTHGNGLVRAAWAEVDNSAGSLSDGMLGRLSIVTGASADVVAVPRDSLLREGNEWSVFVHDVQRDQFLPRRVQVGRRDDRFAEIKAGLQTGERIAVTAVADLRRGYGRIK
jgi:cobalt-zinc-cadmium efflux system membrane fusion protein